MNLRIATGALLLSMMGCSQALTPDAQRTQGDALYTVHCASCHEVDPGIGPRLTKEVIATRVSAQALFTYTRLNMPYNAGNTLTEDEYWAITAYLLARDGFLEAEVVLGQETAASVLLTPKQKTREM